LFKASRSDDGKYMIAGHPGILGMLLSIPSTLRSVIEDPDSHPDASSRLFPNAYADPTDNEEYIRLLGEDRKSSALEKIAVFEKVLMESDVGLGAIAIPENRFDPFLAVLTDLRLILAVELGIEDESWEDTLDEDSFEDPRVTVFHLLGAIQYHLLEATGMVDFKIDHEDNEE